MSKELKIRWCLKCERNKESIKDLYFRDSLDDIIFLRGCYKDNFPNTKFKIYKLERDLIILDSLTLTCDELRKVKL